MNKFNKNETMSLTLSAILCLCAALFVVGCGDSGTFAGTSEEGNELAERFSSSFDEASSSSGGSLAIDRSSSSVKSSSSSEILEPFEGVSSSDRGETKTPPIYEHEPKPGSLDSYLIQFNLKSDVLDKGLLSMKIDYSKDVNLSEPLPPSASATEFDGPWPHKFVKQNMYYQVELVRSHSMQTLIVKVDVHQIFDRNTLAKFALHLLIQGIGLAGLSNSDKNVVSHSFESYISWYNINIWNIVISL